MTPRLTQALLGLSLLLNGFVLAGFAYRSWLAPPEVARREPPGNRPGPMEALSQDLKLDASQKQALHSLFEGYAAGRRDRFREIQKIREEMQAELQKPEFDFTRIDGLIDRMIVLRAAQQKENLRSIAEMSPKLTQAQRERLHAILAERYGSQRPGQGGRRSGQPGQ